MNFLGHAILAYPNPSLTIGNLIADWVKGKNYESYPTDIKKGILHHRFIDSFTDSNIHVKNIIKVLRETQGKYAMVAVDVVLDHFFAKYWNQKFNLFYPEFVQKYYHTISSSDIELSKNQSMVIDIMIKQDWLNRYPTLEGTHKTFLQMKGRMKFPNKFELVTEVVADNYDFFKEESFLFLNQIEEESREFLKIKY